MIEDRSLYVQPHETVRVAWVDIDCCVLGNRTPLTPEAVEKKWRQLLQQDQAASWPCLVGHWCGERFVVCDGRHEYIAALMRGRAEVLVAWLENRGTIHATSDGSPSNETHLKPVKAVPGFLG
jgi:hypothetical protein